jgi:hypothetical protein
MKLTKRRKKTQVSKNQKWKRRHYIDTKEIKTVIQKYVENIL